MRLCWRSARASACSRVQRVATDNADAAAANDDGNDGVRHVLVAVRGDLLHNEVTPASAAVAVSVTPAMSLDALLARASAALRIVADAIYFENGFRVVDATYIRDGERLFVTCSRRSSLSRRASLPPPPSPTTATALRTTTAAAGMKKYKLAVVGPAGVGKTALVLCFVEDDPDHRNGEGGAEGGAEVRRRVTEVDGASCVVEIAELHAQQVTSAALRRRQGFLLVMSVLNSKTCAQLQLWFDELVDAFTPQAPPPVVLVANKIDVHLAQRQVFAEEIRSVARRFNCPFVETSANTGQNVDLAFHTLISLVEARQHCEAGVKPALAIVQRPSAQAARPAAQTPSGCACVLM